jgi:hypothetical protein
MLDCKNYLGQTWPLCLHLRIKCQRDEMSFPYLLSGLVASLLAYSWEREKWAKSGNFPCTEGELLAGLADFLYSVQAKLNTVPSRDIPPSLPGEQWHCFFSRSRANYFKLFILLFCVTYTSQIMWKQYHHWQLCRMEIISIGCLYTQSPGVLSHICPTRPLHRASGAGLEYSYDSSKDL